MESVFGRYRAVIRTISGVYGGAYADDEEFQRIRKEVEDVRAATRVVGRASSSRSSARTGTTAARR